MPSGRTHDGLTWGAAFPLAAGIGYIGETWLGAALFAAGFLFGGLMFGPDLDLPSVQVRRWGPFRGIWTPYQRMFRHRSRWTHGLILGPLFRIVYLGLWLGLALGGFWLAGKGLGAWELGGNDLQLAWALALDKLDPGLVAFALLGIWGGSALHSLADALVSGVKRFFRRRKSRRR